MKKATAIICFIVLVFLSGCSGLIPGGSGDTQLQTSQATDSATDVLTTAAENGSDTTAEELTQPVEDDIFFKGDDPFQAPQNDVDYINYQQVVLRHQGTSDEYGELWCYLLVKNNTDKALYIEALLTAKDSSGNVLKSEKAYFKCVGPNEVSTLIMSIPLMPPI